MTEESKVLKVYESFVLGYCNCDSIHCNENISIRSMNGHIQKFKFGHQSRGKNNASWKGGVISDYHGYNQIKKWNHPNITNHGYIRQHRLIYEHYLSIIFDEDVYIPKEFAVHHIIPIKEGGTNALINLELIPHSEHTRIHKTGKKYRLNQFTDMSNRCCLICKSNKTSTRKSETGRRPCWRKYQGGFICTMCYNRIYRMKKLRR